MTTPSRPDQPTTCVSCHQPISAEAQRCPFCRTLTNPGRRAVNHVGAVLLGLVILAVVLALVQH